jgi:hypothetical protein
MILPVTPLTAELAELIVLCNEVANAAILGFEDPCKLVIALPREPVRPAIGLTIAAPVFKEVVNAFKSIF